MCFTSLFITTPSLLFIRLPKVSCDLMPVNGQSRTLPVVVVVVVVVVVIIIMSIIIYTHTYAHTTSTHQHYWYTYHSNHSLLHYTLVAPLLLQIHKNHEHGIDTLVPCSGSGSGRSGGGSGGSGGGGV